MPTILREIDEHVTYLRQQQKNEGPSYPRQPVNLGRPADRQSQLATLNRSAMDHRVARGARAFMLAPIVT